MKNETEKKRFRILIVDDEESIRVTLEMILSNAGYEVSTTSDGQAALSLVRDADFDVAVVDRILSNSMNGVDVIQEIKKLNPLCETILMSAYPSFESAAQIMEHETFAYLTKPISQDEICKIVADAASKSRVKAESQRLECVLREVFDASPNPIVVYDPDLAISFVNPAFTSLLGYSREQVLGQSLMLVPEEDVACVKDEFESLIKGSVLKEREQVMMRNDGTIVVTSRIVSMCSYSSIRGRDILVIIRDISDEKKMQLQIAQSEKLAMLGELSAKLAHEINNPLQIIFGQTEILLEDGRGDEIKEELGYVKEAARRIEKLTRNLMFVAKPKPVSITCFAPEKTLDKAADFLFSMGQTKYLSVLREYTCGENLVEGDENQLEQVFMNLIANAAHAMEDVREKIITLRTSHDYEQGQVHISVIDTGCGIDAPIQNKIFDPFFTTKESGKGNGLGLSIVKQIVERQGGSISFVSESGSGSTFTVSLPLKQKHAVVVGEGSV